jgi:hypothetical protein
LNRIDKYLKMLSDIEDALTEVVVTPFDKPLASKEVIEAFEKAREISLKYYDRVVPINLAYHSLFFWIHHSILDLAQFVSRANMLCKYAGPVVGFNPCKAYTLDFDIEFMVANFRRLADQAKTRYRDAEDDIKEIEYHSESLLRNLKRISWYCVWVIGVNCLKHATPEEAKPASLRTYVVDLISAIRLVARRTSEKYRGVTEQKVGNAWFYRHPMTMEELLSLATHAILVFHKYLEIAEKRVLSDVSVFSWPQLVLPFRLGFIRKYGMLVYVLKDRLEITLDSDFDIVVKPRWVVDVYIAMTSRKKVEVIRRALSERGYKLEATDDTFKITIPPGDVMEVIKILSTPILLYSIEFANEDEALKFILDIVERV